MTPWSYTISGGVASARRSEPQRPFAAIRIRTSSGRETFGSARSAIATLPLPSKTAARMANRLLHHHSAADIQRLTGRLPRVIRSEEQHGVRHILDLLKSPERT